MVFVRLHRRQVELQVEELCRISNQMAWKRERVTALLCQVESRIEKALANGLIVHLFSIISTVFNEFN